MDCPHCEYSTDTETGLNIHVGRVHGRTRECEWCGEDFDYHPSVDNKFCSDSCFREKRQHNSELKETNCLECEKIFSYHPSASGGKFCSRECFYESDINFSWDEDDERRIDYKESVCLNCNNGFFYNPKKKDGKFCTQECFYESDMEWERPGRSKVEREIYKCYTCGEEIKRLECDVSNPERVFCNDKCRGVWVSECSRFRTTDSVYVEETGRNVRSGWEAEIDRMLYESGLEYDYEPRIFDIGEHSYTPDFKFDKYIIEVKGQVSERDKRRANDFMEYHPDYEYIVVGSKLPCDTYIHWDDRESLMEVIDE